MAENLGVPKDKVTTGGNLKFEITVSLDKEKIKKLKNELAVGGRPVIVAGSTHEGEEQAALRALRACACLAILVNASCEVL